MRSTVIYFFSALFPITFFILVLLFYPIQVQAPLSVGQKNIDSVNPTEILAQTNQLPKANELNPVIVFTGDVMMARDVENYILKNGPDYPFNNLSDLFEGADLVVGNFEMTVREKQNIETTNVMSFDTVPANIDILKKAGFDLLSLANNHTDDFGPDITKLTRSTIENYGLKTFGDPQNSENHVAHQTIGDTTFAFIGFHAFSEKAESLLTTIAEEKSAGHLVIVFPHWGNEYEVTPSSSQVTASHMFIEAGADLIIGAHPHVIQTIETYKGVPIIYSLGNFLFDQSWSEPTKKGLVVKITITKEAFNFELLPIYIQNRQVSKASPEIQNEILTAIKQPSGTFSIPRVSR